MKGVFEKTVVVPGISDHDCVTAQLSILKQTIKNKEEEKYICIVGETTVLSQLTSNVTLQSLITNQVFSIFTPCNLSLKQK